MDSAPHSVAVGNNGGDVTPISTAGRLSLRHLEKHFGGVRALVDGCIEAPSGEVHGGTGRERSRQVDLNPPALRRDRPHRR